LTTPAGHYTATFTVTATGAVGPNAATPTPQTVTLDINVTSGLGLFFYTSQSNNSIVASPTIPGAPASEAPGLTPPPTPCSTSGGTITLCFTSLVGTGQVNPNGDGKVYVIGSAEKATLMNPLSSLNYTFGPNSSGLFNLLQFRPDINFTCRPGVGDINPVNACIFDVDNFNNAAIESLPAGTYTASFTANFMNGVVPNNPVPQSETVNIVLTIGNYPTITAAPTGINYTVSQGSSVSNPQTIALTADSVPGAPIPFTATPSGNGSLAGGVFLNGSALPVQGFITGAGLTDLTGKPLTLTESLNPAVLSTLLQTGGPYTGGILFSIGQCTNFPIASNCNQSLVTDPSINVPVNVNIISTPGLTVTPTAVTFNWTLGDPVIASPTTATLSYTLIGSDTYTVASQFPWVTVAPVPPSTNPSSAALATFTVGINLSAAGAPTTPGTYTANVTATPSNGIEPPVVTVVTLVVQAPPTLTVGTTKATAGTPGTVVSDSAPTVNYNYGAAAPAPVSIPVSLSATTETLSEPLTYSAITYSAGASGWATLTTAPTSVSNAGAGTAIVVTLNPLTPVLAPGTYTATFNVTATDGNVPTTYTSTVAETVTLNVVGSLTATAANSLFTYVIGTSSSNLPLVVSSLPSGVPFTVTTSTNLASSIPSGATPSTPQITVNGANVTTPGQTTGSITITALQSALNCPAAQVSTVNNQSVCTVTVPFNINVHSSFFQGESLISGGGGFYTLPFFGTYAYFPSQLAIYQTKIGEELLFTNTDSSHGIYFYDVNSGHIWYTNPTDFPNVYDFTLGTWLFYETTTGNGTAGSREFYNYTTGKFIFF
jgi:hypothetical protein